LFFIIEKFLLLLKLDLVLIDPSRLLDLAGELSALATLDPAALT
jgi:hypothetical protein